MSHIPVNHPLRPVYRVLAGLGGLYVLIFGIVAFSKTGNHAWFAQHDLPWVLGLRANRAFALLSIVAGAVITVSSLIGRNVDRFVNVVGGTIFMVAGMLMLLVLRTSSNFLGFSMVNVIVSFILGIVFFSAGMYGKVGPPEMAAAEEAYRHHVNA